MKDKTLEILDQAGREQYGSILAEAKRRDTDDETARQFSGDRVPHNLEEQRFMERLVPYDERGTSIKMPMFGLPSAQDVYGPKDPCKITDPTEFTLRRDTDEQRPPTLIQALEELRVKAAAMQQRILAEVSVGDLVAEFSDLHMAAIRADRAFAAEHQLAEDRAWQRWEHERRIMTEALPKIAKSTGKQALYWHLPLKLWYFERAPFPLRDDSLLVASIDGDGTMQQPVVMRTDLQ